MSFIRSVITTIERNIPPAIKNGTVDGSTIDNRIFKLFIGATALAVVTGTPLILTGYLKAGIGCFVGMLFSHIFSCTIYPSWEQARAAKALSRAPDIRK